MTYISQWLINGLFLVKDLSSYLNSVLTLLIVDVLKNILKIV